jgi:hypothetical protein
MRMMWLTPHHPFFCLFFASDQMLVTMRMGGRSTKGWRSNLILNREIVRGNRENGVYTNLAMLVPKYGFKVWEFMRKS